MKGRFGPHCVSLCAPQRRPAHPRQPFARRAANGRSEPSLQITYAAGSVSYRSGLFKRRLWSSRISHDVHWCGRFRRTTSR